MDKKLFYKENFREIVNKCDQEVIYIDFVRKCRINKPSLFNNDDIKPLGENLNEN